MEVARREVAQVALNPALGPRLALRLDEAAASLGMSPLHDDEVERLVALEDELGLR